MPRMTDDLERVVDSFIETWAQLANGSPGHINFDRALTELVRHAYATAKAEAEADLAALRSRGQALVAQWRERGIALCPDRSEHDVATRDLSYMERVERPMGALLLACADALTAALQEK